MIKHCQCCVRQIVSYDCDNEKCIGSTTRNSVHLVHGFCCFKCAEDLDENGLFPEERDKI